MECRGTIAGEKPQPYFSVGTSDAVARLERKEAFEKAPRPARGELQCCTEFRRFPLRA